MVSRRSRLWQQRAAARSRSLAKLDFNNRVQIALLVHDAGLLDEEDDGAGHVR